MCKDNTLKYNIKPLLENLPFDDYRVAMKNLPAILEVSRQTFSKLLNCKLNDNYEPKPIVLVKLASFFKVDVRDLYSNKPDNLTIKDVHIFNQKKVAKQFNLTA